MQTGKKIGQIALFLVSIVIAAVAGWIVFVVVPGGSMARLLGVLLVLGTIFFVSQQVNKVASAFLSISNVAEVGIEGSIERSQHKGPAPVQPAGAVADELIEQIELADARSGIRALLVRLDTGGGRILPSDDIRRAVEEFDGPTVAYIEDTCASGGYWIASCCDEIYARQASIVGGIGIRGSRVIAPDALDVLGLTYERFVSGKFKDTGSRMKEMAEAEREYLQGIVNKNCEIFVDRVVEGRDLERNEVSDMEARLYLGEEAREIGLVDRIGTRGDVEDDLADALDVDNIRVTDISPEKGLIERVQSGLQSASYSFGRGLASAFVDDGNQAEIEFR